MRKRLDVLPRPHLHVLFALAGIRLKVVGKEYMDTPGAKSVCVQPRRVILMCWPVNDGSGRNLSVRGEGRSERYAVHSGHF